LAGLLGRLAGERLATTSLTGGALIVLAVLISDLRLRWSRGEHAIRDNDQAAVPPTGDTDDRSPVTVGAQHDGVI
jgi:hypothetical protein